MNPQETQQVATHDEKWVPFTGRVKISSTNVRLETIVPQKEETFQVVIDLIKNSKCFKAFTIFARCPRNLYAAVLVHYQEVKGVDFNDVPDDDATLAFLIKLGYKGPLYKHTKIENVDYPELIWEDLAFQIDHMKEKRSRQDYHEYGLVIPEVMLNDTIKQSESYQMFIKYSTESEPKPEPVKRKTASRLVVKKKVIISADDNIISDDPDVALELGKSISKIKAEEAEAAMQVHATHARIVNESVPKLTRRRKLGKVTSDPPKKLKGVPSLTPEEQEAADIMQSLKESRKTSRRRPGTRGSNKGTGTIPRVTDESTVISATSSEGTESEYPKEDQLGDDEKDDKDDDADDEGNDYIRDNQDA
ncbi:hypothetical protein Tco_1364524, partial [Tanacetum coccineum]